MAIKHPNAYLLEKINLTESVITELKSWRIGDTLSEDSKKLSLGPIKTKEECLFRIEFLNEHLEMLREKIPLDEMLYLSEIIEKEGTVLEGNNILILSPVGSGKTSFIHEILEKDPGHLALHLVSNTALKESICPEESIEREKKANNTFTSTNKESFGDGNYKIHVMTYSEFGVRIRYTDDFIENIKYIFCDEAHSLPHYQSYDDSADLAAAIKTLFKKYSDKKVYYLTATDEHLKQLEKKDSNLFSNVKTYDFRNHPEIKQYLPLSEYRFNHIEQIRPHLSARIRIFNCFNYKALAFSRTIESQIRLAKMAEQEGFKPLVLWSINNKDAKHVMTEEQLKCRDYILKKGEIPEPYNFLIINSSMQEGWDLVDKKVRLAIMNTTSETEIVQATGRLRRDIDILAYRVKKTEKADVELTIPDKFLNKIMTSEEKDEMCKELDKRNHNGILIAWPGIKKLIIGSSNYQLKEATRRINKKATRVIIISSRKDYD